MDRRQFLVRVAIAAGALITPSFVREAEAFARVEHTPLLLPPAAARHRLVAVPKWNGYVLHFGEPDLEIPRWTWLELAEEHGCYEEHALEFVAEHNDDCTRRELRALLAQPACEWLVQEAWDACYASNTLAFNYLDRLDLGPEFGCAPDARGELAFIEGYRPGDDTRAVEAADELTLSLLQARLIEIGEPTSLEVQTD